MQPPKCKVIKVVGHAWVKRKGEFRRYLIRQSNGPREEHRYLDIERLVFIDDTYPSCFGCMGQNVVAFEVTDLARGVTCNDCGARSFYRDKRL